MAGGSTPALTQSSVAASYNDSPATAAYKSSWFPVAPQVKQWKTAFVVFTLKDRDAGFTDR